MKIFSKNHIKIIAVIIFSFGIFLISLSSKNFSLSPIFSTSIKPASDAPHNVTCNACHLTHTSPGITLTSVNGNANLCISCHNPAGIASGMPFSNSDIAIPGTSGTSHAWDKPAVNATFGANLTTNSEMLARVVNDTIICSTCHDQHSQTYTPFLRASNSGDALCKDCHSIRDIGIYSDDPVNHKGSHPVGLLYDGSDPRLLSSPVLPLQTVGSNIECSSCHQVHYSTSNDGYLLRTSNNNALCTSCHTYGSHNGFSCNDCHQAHNTVKDNIYLIKDIVNGNNVKFYSETGINSFGDEDGTEDGICEVCHTSTSYHLSDGSGASHNPATDCTSCHPHDASFEPADCSDCHISNFPNWGTTDGHYAHTSKYTFACNTCHLDYGFGGSLEPTHPSTGSANINFDPTGLATRNGLDANTPGWDGSNCSNIYCHSNGRSAYRGTDGSYTWSNTTGSQTPTYYSENWGTGSITACTDCHNGIGNMSSPYLITSPFVNPSGPNTGKHISNAHRDNDQDFSSYGWVNVQCFWCHNADGASADGPNYQGTYGTSFHVDGQTHFDPRNFSNGGTVANGMSYSFEGSNAHCGSGKACW